MCLFLAVLGLNCCTDFPLVAESGGDSLVAAGGRGSGVRWLCWAGFLAVGPRAGSLWLCSGVWHAVFFLLVGIFLLKDLGRVLGSQLPAAGSGCPSGSWLRDKDRR